MPGRRATLVVAALAATLSTGALGGCGDDQPPAKASNRRVVLRLDEYRIEPQRITVRAGRVTIVARNVGRLTHNVAIVPYDRAPVGARERRYARSATAHPGQTVSARAVLRPGRYRLVCTLANHDDLGQWGELEVER